MDQIRLGKIWFSTNSFTSILTHLTFKWHPGKFLQKFCIATRNENGVKLRTQQEQRKPKEVRTYASPIHKLHPRCHFLTVDGIFIPIRLHTPEPDSIQAIRSCQDNLNRERWYGDIYKVNFCTKLHRGSDWEVSVVSACGWDHGIWHSTNPHSVTTHDWALRGNLKNARVFQ